MKKVLLAGVAALLLATGAAYSVDICYEVLETSDNFLAMRWEPTAKSKMIGALREGEIVKDLDTGWNKDGTMPKFRKNWTKVVMTDENAKWHYAGWVYKKYLKPIECPEDKDPEALNPPDKPILPPPKLDTVDAPTTDEVRDDWCRRNNWDGQSASCQDKKSLPKWLLEKK